MNTFLQTSSCLQIFAEKNYVLIFGIKPFRRVYHRSKLVFDDIGSLKSTFFPFLGPPHYHFLLHTAHLPRDRVCVLQISLSSATGQGPYEVLVSMFSASLYSLPLSHSFSLIPSFSLSLRRSSQGATGDLQFVTVSLFAFSIHFSFDMDSSNSY